jgi:hypothetical protein
MHPTIKLKRKETKYFCIWRISATSQEKRMKRNEGVKGTKGFLLKKIGPSYHIMREKPKRKS